MAVNRSGKASAPVAMGIIETVTRIQQEFNFTNGLEGGSRKYVSVRGL